MNIARYGSGQGAVIRAILSQVHPMFMLPPLAASWFGSILAREFSLVVGGVHTIAIFSAVYTAHVKDGYVDFHVRGEDDDHPLTVSGCRFALAGATLIFVGAIVGLWYFRGVEAALLVFPTWVIGYHHAPQLDMHPVGATVVYPLGIAIAIVSAYYAQTGTLAPQPMAFGLVFLVLLSGVKTIDDAKDYDYDASIEKPTVAVTLGLDRARMLAYMLLIAGLGIVVAFIASGVFPPGAMMVVAAFAPVAMVAHGKMPRLATMLLVRGAYVFLAILIAAVWFRPLG